MATRIKIIDGSDVPSPEDTAMLMAMYSRSPAPVEVHLEKIAKVGSGNFMAQFYTGYGHESIGELGTISVFLEGLSMAAAKAFQDNPLYRGQECSTRYIDFSNQPFYHEIVPEKYSFNESANALMEEWRTLYQEALPLVKEDMRIKYPAEYVLPKGKESDTVLYEKTLKAITFDLCRGLLPIGATTSVAWSGDFRTVGRHCRRLMCHPLKEVRVVATNLYDDLLARYPSSFKLLSNVPEDINPNFYYTPQHQHGFNLVKSTDPFFEDITLKDMPKFTEKGKLDYMPTQMQHSVMFHMRDNIDYASYRDLQRHRNGFMSLSAPHPNRMPNDNNWYLHKYPSSIFLKATRLYEKTLIFIAANPDTKTNFSYQYLLPMLADVPVSMKWNFYQTVYVCNLRSGVTVHPSLRDRVKVWADAAKNSLGFDPFTLDSRGDYQNSHRGAQDIVDIKNSI